MVDSTHTGGRKESLILSNNRAIVLHQGGQCRWAGGMKGWLIRAQQPRRKRISCKGQIIVPSYFPNSAAKLTRIIRKSNNTSNEMAIFSRLG